MSEEPRITASSHPEVAKRHGLTHWDRDRGQWVRPPETAAVEPEAEVEAEVDETPDDGYDDLSYRELQQLAKERGLDATGKQDDIVARLRGLDRATRGD